MKLLKNIKQLFRERFTLKELREFLEWRSVHNTDDFLHNMPFVVQTSQCGFSKFKEGKELCRFKARGLNWRIIKK
jgi:DNA-binding transcriptional MerR regulator